jgi:hypothetical protein
MENSLYESAGYIDVPVPRTGNRIGDRPPQIWPHLPVLLAGMMPQTAALAFRVPIRPVLSGAGISHPHDEGR